MILCLTAGLFAKQSETSLQPHQQYWQCCHFLDASLLSVLCVAANAPLRRKSSREYLTQTSQRDSVNGVTHAVSVRHQTCRQICGMFIYLHQFWAGAYRVQFFCSGLPCSKSAEDKSCVNSRFLPCDMTKATVMRHHEFSAKAARRLLDTLD